MNADLEPQPAQPKRKISLGLVSLLFVLLGILCVFNFFYSVDKGDVSGDFVFFALPLSVRLPVIAIIIGGVDLYLTNRKVPVDAILALIIVLTLLAFMYAINPLTIKRPDIFLNLSEFAYPLVLMLGVLCALIQIPLAIANKKSRLARIAIALAILLVLFLAALEVELISNLIT